MKCSWTLAWSRLGLTLYQVSSPPTSRLYLTAVEKNHIFEIYSGRGRPGYVGRVCKCIISGRNGNCKVYICNGSCCVLKLAPAKDTAKKQLESA